MSPIALQWNWWNLDKYSPIEGGAQLSKATKNITFHWNILLHIICWNFRRSKKKIGKGICCYSCTTNFAGQNGESNFFFVRLLKLSAIDRVSSCRQPLSNRCIEMSVIIDMLSSACEIKSKAPQSHRLCLMCMCDPLSEHCQTENGISIFPSFNYSHLNK